MDLNINNKYFAFISYKREDEEWAIWLQHELEYYHLPASLNGRDDLPKEFRPVFRDIDELKAGNLPQQIYDALASSLNLIVVCSPQSANSKWVNKEINDFIEIGKKKGINNLDRVFPFIVEGTPHAKDEAQECFPKILRGLSGDKERIGGNVNESGRDKAFIKVMAGMLPNVDFDMLWNRYERDKAEQEQKEREEKRKLQIAQSRFVSEKALKIAHENSYLARRLAIEVLPNKDNPDRPVVPEAESALRKGCQFSTTVLCGHANIVTSLAFSPDAKLLVSASVDGTLKLWDIVLGKEIHTFRGHEGAVLSVNFSSDGKRIISASADKTIKIWDIEKKEAIRTLFGHSKIVNYSDFCPNNNKVVSASDDGTIKIWDLEDNNVQTIEDHIDGVFYASFGYDDSRIVSYSDSAIKIWNVRTKKELFIEKDVDLIMSGSIFGGFTTTYKPVSISSDSKRGAFLSNNCIKIRSIKTGKLICTLNGHTKDVCSARFSLNGKLIVSASKDGTIKIWDATSGKEYKTLKGDEDGYFYATFSYSGRYVVAISKSNLKLWDLFYENDVQTIEIDAGISEHDIISSIGSHIAFTAKDETIRIWNIMTKKPKLFADGVSDLQASGILWEAEEVLPYDISFVAKKVVYVSLLVSIIIQDIRKGKKAFRILENEFGHSNYITSAVFSRDGKLLVSASMDKTLIIWDVKTGKGLRVLKGHVEDVNYATFSPNGRIIASASKDKTIILWDVKNGSIIRTLCGHTDSVVCVDFSLDGKKLISASKDNMLILWDIETGKSSFAIKHNAVGRIPVLFSPDNKIAVSSSGINEIIVIDISTGEIIRVLKGHTQYVNSLAFSKDGKYLASSSFDKTIKVWDVEHGVEINSIDINYFDTLVWFDQDENHLISGFSDGTIHVWDFPPLQDLIDQTCERFKDRPLTSEERRMYYLE